MSGLNHYKYIDALRGIAFLGVLTIHTSQNVQPLVGSVVTVAGQYGVQLFFLLSAVTLLRSMSLRREEKFPVRNFFVRRFFRIAPLFWCGIVFYLSLNGRGSDSATPDRIAPWQIAVTVLFLHGWAPASINRVVPGGWSIAVEMTFYACLPFLAARIRSLQSACIAFFITLVAAIGIDRVLYPLLMARVPLARNDLLNNFLIWWFPSQLPVFMLGFVVYHCLHSATVTTFLAGPGHPEFVMRCATAAIFALMCLYASPLLPLHVGFALAFAAIILAVAARPFAVVVNRTTCGLGVLSYSCYITHFAALSFVTHFVKRSDFAFLPVYPASVLEYIVVWFAALLLTAAMSTLTYFIIEKPGMKLGSLLIRATN